MYLRPLLLGTGGTLGLAAAPEFTFVIYSAAVGSYFAGGTLAPINLKVEDRYHRAAPLGVGAAKCAGASCLLPRLAAHPCSSLRLRQLPWRATQWLRAGNYGAGLMALMAAKKEGFSDVVYLDARTDSNLEELSAANIFVVKVRTVAICEIFFSLSVAWS